MRKILTLLAVPLAVAACSEQPTSPPLDVMEAGDVSYVTVVDGQTTSAILLAAQDVPVGEVFVTHNADGTIEIEYVMDPGFCLAETHWDVVNDPGDLTNRGGNPKIGQFRYGDDDLGCVTSWSDTGEVPDPSGEYYVAAHAVVLGTGGAGGDLPIVYGILDVAGDGPDEGDIYGINPQDGSTFLVAAIDNDAAGDPFSPNGLALDRETETLFYSSRQVGGSASDLFAIAADGTGGSTLVRSDLAGDIYNATVDDGFYYFVPNKTDDLWRVAVDGLSAPELYCDLHPDEPRLFFGDIAALPDDGTIYGVASIEDSDVVFFEVNIAACPASGATFTDPTTYDFLLQVAFGDDGTLYGQKAVSAGGADAGRWWELDPATGEIIATLGQSTISFTDLAGGLPVVVDEFEETAWADGTRFTNRGSWATYMGPFEFE